MGHQNPIKREAKTQRIVRYDELVPCFDAFIDTRTPGSDQKENFTIIGPGVSENPNQFVHIKEPHGFNIGGARQPPGCVNSQHSHHTVEVFFIHKGTWSFDLGEHGTDANITLGPGDLLSIPTNVFRGFKNIGKDIGFLWAVLGGDDPGRVMWAPQVFDMAKDYGLVLLENGMLIDADKGQTVPDGAKIMPVTSQTQMNELDVFNNEQLRECCVLSDEHVLTDTTDDYRKRAILGPEGKLNWDHGFTIDMFELAVSSEISWDPYSGNEVIFVHDGCLRIETSGESYDIGSGDTVTIPKGASRRLVNIGNGKVDFVRVQGEV